MKIDTAKNVTAFPVSVITIMFMFGSVCAQKNMNTHQNLTFQQNIKSVIFHKKGWELSDPIMELNSQDNLQLSFDELGDQLQTYNYTIIHCNASWESSNLADNEYIQGFTNAQIREYSYSFNTTYDYIHYALDFPNDEMSPKISGNYILRVFKDFDPEKKILERRFYVTENGVEVNAAVKRPGNVEFRDKGQKIDFKILYKGFRISDPYSDIQVTIMQNGRSDNAITTLKPRFIGNNELDYSYDFENVFQGGNEFRYFDIKSMR